MKTNVNKMQVLSDFQKFSKSYQDDKKAKIDFIKNVVSTGIYGDKYDAGNIVNGFGYMYE